MIIVGIIFIVIFGIPAALLLPAAIAGGLTVLATMIAFILLIMTIIGVVLLIIGILLSISKLYANNNDTVLLKINNNEITKSEFLRIYNKNNDNSYDSKTIKEYLELFINFKLKVFEAEKLGLDTTQKSTAIKNN